MCAFWQQTPARPQSSPSGRFTAEVSSSGLAGISPSVRSVVVHTIASSAQEPNLGGLDLERFEEVEGLDVQVGAGEELS